MATKVLIPANQDPNATVTYNSHLGGSIEIKACGTVVEASLADEILGKLGFCVQEAPAPKKSTLRAPAEVPAAAHEAPAPKKGAPTAPADDTAQ